MNDVLPRLTCLSPDRQVFVLLNVQHELESITHTSLGGDEKRASITASIKGVTLPIASKDLRDTRERFFLSFLNDSFPLGVSVWLDFWYVCVNMCVHDRDSMTRGNEESGREKERRRRTGRGGLPVWVCGLHNQPSEVMETGRLVI